MKPNSKTAPLSALDLVMMDRVSDPQLSPDGKRTAFVVRETDLAANKGVTCVWILDFSRHPLKPRRLTQGKSPRWSADGKALYFLSDKSGSTQLWRASGHHAPRQASALPLDINSFKLSPGGRYVLLSLDVFPDSAGIKDTRRQLDARKTRKTSGRVYHRLFVRHWNTWMDGRRSQLFLAKLGTDGTLRGKPLWLTRSLDGDIPSRPDGSDNEYAFSPDGKTVYFNLRIAGQGEAWSTNFDIYSVPADGSASPRSLTAPHPAWDGYPIASPDGRTLYYLSMKTPGFERDRFRIKTLNLATGRKREIAPRWDRSAGPLQISADGTTLYTTADDDGRRRLFAINTANGAVTRMTNAGSVSGFHLAGDKLLLAHETFDKPANLYLMNAGDTAQKPLTHFNDRRVAKIRFGEWEWFSFKGWNGERVHGYVMQPANFRCGRQYPVAFLIHGGPQGAWNENFHYRWNPQVFAGAGFAVVAINFHGSTGYGQAFTDSISGHWGDRPLIDLQKGWAAALRKYRFLDTRRACALGASYGGYMVYWLAGMWNRPWRCLVAHNGVFDTRIMYYATDELWFNEHEGGGTQYDVPREHDKFSPLNHVKKWHVPMLVVHSNHDYRIPLSQGLAAFTALQRRGIPSEFLNFPDETHFVSNPQNSLQWHETAITWMKRWTEQ